MKKSILVLVVFFFAFGLCVGTASAQITTPYDSLAIDSVLTASGTDSPQNVEGLPDSKEATVSPSSGLLGVDFYVNGAPLRLQKGAQLHFYWEKLTSDSCGGFIAFIHLPDEVNPNYSAPSGDTALVMEGGEINQEQMTTLIVPDTAINNISIEVAAYEKATLFYIDAIIIDQGGKESVALQQNQSSVLLSSYPNPFYRAAGTTLHVTSNTEGNGQIRIYDVLGNIVEQAQVGELTPGEQAVKIALDRPGIFFARLFVNGQPSGEPLKITSE